MADLAKYGPWAVIAGGSEGVGAEFAQQLASGGCNLVLIARKPGPLEATARKCREIGAEVRALALDLTDPQSTAPIIAETAGESLVLGRAGAGYRVWRATANHFELQRIDARWRPSKRTSRVLDGQPGAHALLRRGLAGAAAPALDEAAA
ncbi:SDR family NAD(P)-dependent oxidoreductase [Mycobacterium sp. E796]|uniref:SDR family NAD(P)-dependent oxidoreductase n=1 Tax=Mycobacterium sp. E796 TaxID=1834151 RepID=UPI0009EEF9EC